MPSTSREGSASGRVERAFENRARGRVRQQDGAATGREDDALGREDDDRAVAGVVARDVVPSERLAHLAPAATSHTRRRNDVLSRRILRKWASPGCAATLALMEATTRSERTGHSAWLVISPRRRSSAAIHDADTHATSRPAGVVGASWGRVDDGDAMVDADGRSERRARREVRQPSRDAPLSAPSEPRRGRAGRGRRASRKGRRRLWDPQPEKVGTTSQSLPGASFSKLAPDLKKQALPSAVTTTRVAHEPSPSSG